MHNTIVGNIAVTARRSSVLKICDKNQCESPPFSQGGTPFSTQSRMPNSTDELRKEECWFWSIVTVLGDHIREKKENTELNVDAATYLFL
jgi:hypothetical protein